MFNTLDRVTYLVSDVASARDWYRKVLDRDPVFDSPFAVIFSIGSAGLVLIPGKAPQSDSKSSTIPWWSVEDVDTAHQRLLDLGAVPVFEVTTSMGSRMVRLNDPFGNVFGILCHNPDAEKQSVEKQPSESAYNVALSRAIAARDDHGPDHLADVFLAEETKRVLSDAASREFVRKMLTPELYGYLRARTVWLDRIFVDALRGGIPQIVFLGAGYDSRSYRFRDLIGSTRIFELDAEATQNRKRQRLIEAGIAVPDPLTFIATNFRSDDLEPALLDAGFDRCKKTLFIWEGVTYYLPSEAVNATLDFVRTHSPADSVLCFDYMSEVRKTVYAGEPFQFFIASEELEALVSEHGFDIAEHLHPADIAAAFLDSADGSTQSKTLHYANFVQAIVKG